MGVKSADRVIQLLELFADTTTPLRMNQIAKALVIPKSSLSVLLKGLVDSGYLYFSISESTFYPSYKWKSVVGKILAKDPLPQIAGRILQDLVSATQETALLGYSAEDRVVYGLVAEPDRVIRFTARPGDTRPIFATSSGRALLSMMDHAQRNAILAGVNFTRYTDLTVNDAIELQLKIEAEQKQGWHENLGEHHVDTASASVPVMIEGNPFALIVGAPKTRFLEHRLKIVEALKKAAIALN
jgi:IclR family acetate operon transcriptional repressor